MPIDGVSFQNSGFNIANPTEVNVAAESAAKKEAEKLIKETEESDKTQEDNEDTQRDGQGRDTQDSEDQEEKLKELTEKKKKFVVKFNAETEMVEMVDVITGEVVETVSPNDLINLLSKSKAFSGVLVDRKI